MDNTKKLTKLIAENPNVEVVFMYPEEHSDHSYTFGKMYKVELDEYVLMDEKCGGRVMKQVFLKK